ncbi:hypothetical protein E2C01_088337 [Portunus trituberculatus]|uniref:Uncharacterized protein n=1 Tax=Portunus trituberculatus TaxID=210409 RepID=A0A5B7JLN1_PORTR|nr:hypothetical protein [Portunus trituberculatus]
MSCRVSLSPLIHPATQPATQPVPLRVPEVPIRGAGSRMQTTSLYCNVRLRDNMAQKRKKGEGGKMEKGRAERRRDG